MMAVRICIFLIFFSDYFSIYCRVSAYKIVKVANYNIWNVMFQWETRKYFIAEMINKINPDVIGFQEVRADAKDERNQLTELQELIPRYKHLVYHPVAVVTHPAGQQGPPGWEQEGLGILSKHPIILSHVVNLTIGKGGVDRNKRAILHAQVDIDGDELDITVLHLSYDKAQQCKNAVDVINYIASMGSERSVLLGDFNAYNDFHWPVNGIMKGSFDKQGPCHASSHLDPQGLNQGYGFVDAWVTANGNSKGYTFSNMPEPGLISRPDRILVSLTGLQVVSAEINGDGKIYQQKYSLQNKWQRLKKAYLMAKETAYGPRFKYTCHQDCGPHGSCRCGVCVKGGDTNNCELPFCFECNAEHFNNFILIFVLYSTTLVFFLYILIKMLIQRCFSKMRRVHARVLFLLSNRTLGIVVVCLMAALYFITMTLLQDTLETVNGRIAEEMFPSDHMMVTASLKFTYR